MYVGFTTLEDEMDGNLELLAGCPLFREVTQPQIEAMLKCMKARRKAAARGEVVFLEDSPAEYVGVVLSGEVRVLRDDVYGNRTIQAVIQPGGMFGETFACAGLARLPVSVEASQPSEVLLIPLKHILHTCANACGFHNRVIMNLLKVLAEKNLQLNGKLEIASRRTIREKLMAYLANQARQAGSSAFTIPLDRQGLADYLGVDRSALSAEIGKLRREGLIESNRSAFRLLAEERGQ